MSFLNQIYWRPTIGDPSLMGWITVVAYFATALASLVFSFQKPDPVFRNFWIMLSLFLLVLGVNKQLDLQSLLTDIGRVISRYQGWYQKRRGIQFEFVVLIFTVTIAAVIGIIWKLHASIKQFLFPLTGLVLLLGFILIRAISFHHVDRFLKIRLAGVRMNWFLELGGIGIILFAALRGIMLAKLSKSAW